MANLWASRAYERPDTANPRIGEAFGLHFADFAIVNGVIYAYYIKSNAQGRLGVGLATSTNGTTFARQGRILAHQTSGFESVNIGTPDLFRIGTTWYLTYHGYDATTLDLGSVSGVPFIDTCICRISTYTSLHYVSRSIL